MSKPYLCARKPWRILTKDITFQQLTVLMAVAPPGVLDIAVAINMANKEGASQ
jgi:hypothetical protein